MLEIGRFEVGGSSQVDGNIPQKSWKHQTDEEGVRAGSRETYTIGSFTPSVHRPHTLVTVDPGDVLDRRERTTTVNDSLMPGREKSRIPHHHL